MMFGIAERHGILVDNCIDNIMTTSSSQNRAIKR